MAGVILDKDKRISSLVRAVRIARSFAPLIEPRCYRDEFAAVLDNALASIEHDPRHRGQPNAEQRKRGRVQDVGNVVR